MQGDESAYCSLATFLLHHIKLALYPSTEASLFTFNSFLLGPNNCFIPGPLWPSGSNSSALTSPGFCTFLMVPPHLGFIFVKSLLAQASLNDHNWRMHLFSTKTQFRNQSKGGKRGGNPELMTAQRGKSYLERYGALWPKHCADS